MVTGCEPRHIALDQTPLAAGGCYKSDDNMAARKDMSPRCQQLEDELGEIQGQRLEYWKTYDTFFFIL